MRVAVLGTGIMGAGMVRNLARAGHHVVVGPVSTGDGSWPQCRFRASYRR